MSSPPFGYGVFYLLHLAGSSSTDAVNAHTAPPRPHDTSLDPLKRLSSRSVPGLLYPQLSFSCTLPFVPRPFHHVCYRAVGISVYRAVGAERNRAAWGGDLGSAKARERGRRIWEPRDAHR
ncbi:hypothetical protein C8R45DRAFT_1091148 [Mycena sanguinolenta]|nr:hypothetical protein C8R45DRAFT_1091148 [Mycena sanguinolenta]